MVAMTAAEVGLQVDRPLTIEDLDQMQDDGFRHELDDGILVVYPAPTLIHQLVVSRLMTWLDAQAPAGFVVLAGPGVEISPIQYRIPDISVVKSADIDIADRSITKPPVLVVEVASPSTASYDRNRKKDVYAAFGISSYWIVKPDLKAPGITAFELRRGGYRLVNEVTGIEPFSASRPFTCQFVPADLVAEPARR